MGDPRWLTIEDLDRIEAEDRRGQRDARNGHAPNPRPQSAAEPSAKYSKILNSLFDDLPCEKDLDPASFTVLLQLCRLTFGMHSTTLTTVVSIERLAARCNISPATCNRALHRLVEVQLIERVKRTGKGGRQVASMIRVLLEEKG